MKDANTCLTPERLSVTCAVTLTVAGPVEVLIAVGLKVKLTKTGGWVSEASAGSAATIASDKKKNVLAELRTKLQFPHADMATPPETQSMSGTCLSRHAYPKMGAEHWLVFRGMRQTIA
jgi:hypothetical protein